MQITLFYDCYYSSPSVKRSSHTLRGRSAQTVCCATFPLRWCQTTSIFSLLFAESALLFCSASGHCSLSPGSCRMYVELHFQSCHSPPVHQMPSAIPAHPGSPVQGNTSCPSVHTPASLAPFFFQFILLCICFPDFVTSSFILDILYVLTCRLYIICRLDFCRLCAI